MDDPMDVWNIHSHAKGFGCDQDIEVPVAEPSVYVVSCRCVETAVIAFDLASGSLRQALGKIVGVCAAGHEDDDRASLPGCTPIFAGLLYCLLDVGKTFGQSCFKILAVQNIALNQKGIHVDMRT